jgi:hypothetical protein
VKSWEIIADRLVAVVAGSGRYLAPPCSSEHLRSAQSNFKVNSVRIIEIQTIQERLGMM